MPDSANLIEGARYRMARPARTEVVYTTFRLTRQTHRAIKELASIYGTIAWVFSDLSEQVATFEDELRGLPKKDQADFRDDILKTLAGASSKERLESSSGAGPAERQKKTYAVRKTSINTLNSFTKKFKGWSRDTLVEVFVRMLKAELDEEKAILPTVYEQYIHEVDLLLSKLDDLESEAYKVLANYDPFGLADRLREPVVSLQALHRDLVDFLSAERGSKDNPGSS